MQDGSDQDIIRVEDRYYILATTPLADDRTRVIKHGDTFAVFDPLGDLSPVGLGQQGVYHAGTRHLNHLRLRLHGRRPLLLRSHVREPTARLAVDLANADITVDGKVILPRDTIHVARTAFLWDGACYIRLRLRSYLLHAVDLALSVSFGADFADVFEVRGIGRPRRGLLQPPRIEGDAVVLAYQGLDGATRMTVLEFAPGPSRLSASEAVWDVHVPPAGEVECQVTVRCGPRSDSRPLGYDAAARIAAAEVEAARCGEARVHTSNHSFDAWLSRSAADLHMMLGETGEGPYPYAGVPWFSTPFGRDGIITALEYLWVNPTIAAGVLRYLAATQATAVEPERDAQPGKILHEARLGEMAALGEVPFGRYYGSVDATPLFVMLAGAYYTRTADLALVGKLWPNVERALHWIHTYGDVDGDGFVEYARMSKDGLVVQGWKDSCDSVFHADGTLAEAPVALCEVQGYVYGALLAAARLAAALGKRDVARDCSARADALRERFEAAFWCEDLDTYALALDARKRACRVVTSNPGHCLFAGIADPERAARVARTLCHGTSFSGWGVRTVAATEARYNPMSYHNGSVWPHDNAIIAAGFARYGFRDLALLICTGMFEASSYLDLHRLPELFCGFQRRPHEGPILYPLACAPQAWAAAAAYSLLQSILGLELDAVRGVVRLDRPTLPPWLETVRIEGLRLRDRRFDLALSRRGGRVEASISGSSDDLAFEFEP